MAEKHKNDPEFSRDELINAAPAVFGVAPEVMAGALFYTPKASKKEAARLVSEFLIREVSN